MTAAAGGGPGGGRTGNGTVRRDQSDFAPEPPAEPSLDDARQLAGAGQTAEVSVFIDVPDALANKARWVLETLLAAVWVRPRFVTDAAAAVGCALAYAPQPVAGVPTIPVSDEAAALIAERRPLAPQSFGAFDLPGASAGADVTTDGSRLVGAFPVEGEGFAVPFDLVCSAFALLACWDELTVPSRDRHGRFPFAESLFATNDALRVDEPACDAYAARLAALLEPRCAELGVPGPQAGGGADVPRFLVALTHDVDQLRRWTARGWFAWARRLALDIIHRPWARARVAAGAALHYLRHDLPQGGDPAYTFPELLAGEDELGVTSTFYVIASHQHRTDGNQPGTYAKRRPELLRLLAAAGREVGLHGNHRDSVDGAALAADRSSLAEAVACAAGTPAPVRGIRYHYLKCLYHTSLPLVEAAGFAYDTSLAFAEQEGFRCGFSHPFQPYDVERDRPLDVVELPLAIMDSTLQERHYRHLDAGEARTATLAVLERVRSSSGCAAILWHHNRFHPYVGRGYGDAYWDVVRWVRENGGECVPAGEAVKLWRQRCAGVYGRDAHARDAGVQEAGATLAAASQTSAYLAPGTSAESAPEAFAGSAPDASAESAPAAGEVLVSAPAIIASGGADRQRVVHVSVVHRPDDPRIFERECRSLADAGYDVTYLAPGAGSAFTEGVHLANLPRRPRTTRWLSCWPIMTELHRLQPDVVHVHDPELLALFPALRPLVPCLVYDMHEYVSQAVENKYYIPEKLRPPAARATVGGQRALVAVADGVAAVVDEQFEQLGARPGLRVTLPNYPRFARFRDAQPRPERYAAAGAAVSADVPPGGRLRLIYIGSLTRNRGVDLMLEVLRQAGDPARSRGGTCSTPAVAAAVKAAAAGEPAGRLHLLGRVPPAEVPGWLAGADVVWVPARRTSQYTRPTVATKLFEGMAVGLAVLVSDLPGRAEVVRGENCGLVVEPTIEGHLDGVRRLAADRAAARAMGERARAAVQARYCWEAIEDRLVDFYAELLARRRGSRR